MSVDHNEIKVVRLLDTTTPKQHADDEVLVVFEHGDLRKGADYSGSHILYQDVFVPTLDAGYATADQTADQKAMLEKFLTDEPGRAPHDGLWFV